MIRYHMYSQVILDNYLYVLTSLHDTLHDYIPQYIIYNVF
jgi:hypothetical protein